MRAAAAATISTRARYRDPPTHARSPPRADVMKDKTCWLVLFTSWNHDLTDPNDDAWKPYYALAMDRGLEMKIGKLNVEEQPEVRRRVQRDASGRAASGRRRPGI